MKKIKVVEISGLKGIFLTVYAIICAAAGFIFFPAWVFMSLWNLFGSYVYALPKMNLIHGFMLYAVAILLYLALNSSKSNYGISAGEITNSHITAIMKDFDDKK